MANKQKTELWQKVKSMFAAGFTYRQIAETIIKEGKYYSPHLLVEVLEDAMLEAHKHGASVFKNPK